MTASERQRFSKYDEAGAYHWKECDLRSRTYNPPLVARYEAVAKRIPEGKRILDLGCGDGYLMHLIASQAASVTGVDPEPSAVRLAKRMLKGHTNCNVMEGSACDLPFAASSFEVVVLADVIEHIDDDKACLREAARVLIPSGRLIVSTPRRRAYRPMDPNHVREYAADELHELCACFFTTVRVSCIWPIWWSKMYRTKIGWRVIREVGRYLYNPFAREGTDPARFAQFIVECNCFKSPMDQYGDALREDHEPVK